MAQPTLGELERRVNALGEEVDELRELVDGQESWSHRKRLHVIENKLGAEELVAAALKELRGVRSARVRADATLVLAGVAILVSVFHPHLHL
jgi:hypothetical protein